MKSRTIKAVLIKKVEDFLSSIKEERVRDILKENMIITGGAITSMLENKYPNDFDIYFRTQEAALAVTGYFVNEFLSRNKPKGENIEIPIHTTVSDEGRIRIYIKSAGIASATAEEGYQYFETVADPDAVKALEYVDTAIKAMKSCKKKKEDKYVAMFMSENAITLSDGIQLIIRFYGEPEQIHLNYDFVHCTNYFTTNNNELVLKPEAIESTITKELKYVGSLYPVCSFIRLRKFIKRGWKISAGQILKMAYNLNNFDLNDINVLREQLVGVDVAYFTELIELLQEKQKQKGDKKIDANYLMEVIDKIF